MPYYKDSNNQLHFLDKNEFETILPADCVAITDVDAESIQNPPITLLQAQATKAFVIRTAAATKMESIASPYFPQERESWDTQLSEADAYTANNTIPTPLLLAMATARGITVAVLVTKIYENANLYRAAIGVVLGKQQALLDKVYAATTIDAVNSITCVF